MAKLASSKPEQQRSNEEGRGITIWIGDKNTNVECRPKISNQTFSWPDLSVWPFSSSSPRSGAVVPAEFFGRRITQKGSRDQSGMFKQNKRSNSFVDYVIQMSSTPSNKGSFSEYVDVFDNRSPLGTREIKTSSL